MRVEMVQNFMFKSDTCGFCVLVCAYLADVNFLLQKEKYVH